MACQARNSSPVPSTRTTRSPIPTEYPAGSPSGPSASYPRPMPDRVLDLPGCTVDLGRCEVRSGDQVQPLTPQETALLAYLAARPGTVVPLPELQTEVWGYAPHVD